MAKANPNSNRQKALQMATARSIDEMNAKMSKGKRNSGSKGKKK